MKLWEWGILLGAGYLAYSWINKEIKTIADIPQNFYEQNTPDYLQGKEGIIPDVLQKPLEDFWNDVVNPDLYIGKGGVISEPLIQLPQIELPIITKPFTFDDLVRWS